MYSYHKTSDYRKNGMHCMEYVVRINDTPVDRFRVFYTGGQWSAWTADTISESTKARRRAFAASLSA
jgi:hypothetical protein